MVTVLLLLALFFPVFLVSDPTQEELKRRHNRFKDLYFRQNEEEFSRLVSEGQCPKTLFIGCSDSRVIPELITLSKPGDLFVVRTAGNFIPPYGEADDHGVLGTIEFGVHGLGVEEIIVCGHSHCGAIRGLYQDLDEKMFPHLKKWLRLGDGAKEMTEGVPEDKKMEQTEKTSVIFQLQNLLSHPFIKEKVDANQIRLHGWYFEIESGEVHYYSRENFKFKLLN